MAIIIGPPDGRGAASFAMDLFTALLRFTVAFFAADFLLAAGRLLEALRTDLRTDLRADFRVDFRAADLAAGLREDFRAADLRRVVFFAAVFLPDTRLKRPRAGAFRAAIGILLRSKDYFPATTRSPRSAASRFLN